MTTVDIALCLVAGTVLGAVLYHLYIVGRRRIGLLQESSSKPYAIEEMLRCRTCGRLVPDWFQEGFVGYGSLGSTGGTRMAQHECFVCGRGFPFYPKEGESEIAYFERYRKRYREKKRDPREAGLED